MPHSFHILRINGRAATYQGEDQPLSLKEFDSRSLESSKNDKAKTQLYSLQNDSNHIIPFLLHDNAHHTVGLYAKKDYVRNESHWVVYAGRVNSKEKIGLKFDIHEVPEEYNKGEEHLFEIINHHAPFPGSQSKKPVRWVLTAFQNRIVVDVLRDTQGTANQKFSKLAPHMYRSQRKQDINPSSLLKSMLKHASDGTRPPKKNQKQKQYNGDDSNSEDDEDFSDDSSAEDESSEYDESVIVKKQRPTSHKKKSKRPAKRAVKSKKKPSRKDEINTESDDSDFSDNESDSEDDSENESIDAEETATVTKALVRRKKAPQRKTPGAASKTKSKANSKSNAAQRELQSKLEDALPGYNVVVLRQKLKGMKAGDARIYIM